MMKQLLIRSLSCVEVPVLICVICGALFSSCSPQKRLQSLLKHHPELLQSDTLTIRDTIYTNPITIDTVFVTRTVDTILVTKENLTTQVIRHNDTIFILSKYNGDTIYIEKQIPIEKIKIIKPDNWGLLIEKIPWVALSIVALFLVGLFFLKK